MSTQIDHQAFISTLDRLGEDGVQAHIDQGLWGNNASKINIAHSLLRSKDSARRDSREEETLSIARSANEEARSANSIASKALRSDVRSEKAAYMAAIAAIIAAAAAISEYINNAPVS